MNFKKLMSFSPLYIIVISLLIFFVSLFCDIGKSIAGVLHKQASTSSSSCRLGAKKKLEALFLKNSVDLSNVDRCTYSFLHNNNISRVDKINFLWALIQKHKESSVRVQYLLDSLTNLKPVELADRLIDEYRTQKSTDVRRKIVSLMKSSIVYKTKAETKKITKKQIQNIIEIHNFLKSISAKNNTATILSSGVTKRASYQSKSGNILNVSFYAEKDVVLVLFGNKREFVLPRALSGSGARYSNDKYTFWEHQGIASLWEGKKLIFKGRFLK